MKVIKQKKIISNPYERICWKMNVGKNLSNFGTRMNKNG